MTTFDKREQAFESKFAHDEELKFRTVALRNRLLGLWAAAKLGKTGSEADQFAQTIVLADLARSDEEDVVEAVTIAFDAANVSYDESDIRLQMDRLLETAREQVKAKM